MDVVDAEKQSSAIQCLAELKSDGAFSSLVNILKDGPANLAILSAKALGEKSDERAIPHLIAVLDLIVLDGRGLAAKKTLRKFGAVAVPQLIEALQLKKACHRNDVIALLGEIGGPAALNALRDIILDQNPYECKKSRKALQNMGAAAIPIFLEALDSNFSHVRENGLIGLAKVDWPIESSYLPNVLPLLKDADADVRKEVVTVLLLKESVSALPEMRQALEEEKAKEVRERISMAIDRLLSLSKKS